MLFQWPCVSDLSGCMLHRLDQLKSFSKFMGSHLGEGGTAESERPLTHLHTLAAGLVIK